MSRLLAFPYYPDNAWQDILYGSARDAGWQIQPLLGLTEIAEAEGAGTVLHLGWTTPIVQTAASVVDAVHAVEETRVLLDGFRNRGGRVLWTIHNVLPHELNYVVPELSLAKMLVEVADVVHVMARNTAQLVRPFYPIDGARIAAIPHPSYLGTYPEPPSRVEARAELGIDVNAVLALAIGTIRPYKGIERLTAMSHLMDAPDELAIVGQFSGGLRPADVRGAVGPRCRIVDGYQDDRALSLWCSAADAMVLPYTNILNSGTLELAASFGLPAIVPPLPAFEELDPAWVRTVDFDANPGHALDALHGLAGDEFARAAAIEYARRHPPTAVSEEFRGLLDELIESDGLRRPTA